MLYGVPPRITMPTEERTNNREVRAANRTFVGRNTAVGNEIFSTQTEKSRCGGSCGERRGSAVCGQNSSCVEEG